MGAMTTSDAAPDTPLPTAPLPTDSLRLYRVGNATRRDFLRLGWLKRTFWVVADTADHAAEAALAAGRIDQLEDADVTDQTMIQIYKLAHSMNPGSEQYASRIRDLENEGSDDNADE